MHQEVIIKISCNGWGGRFLGPSLIIIKWTWRFFLQKFKFEPPLQLGTKKYIFLFGFFAEKLQEPLPIYNF